MPITTVFGSIDSYEKGGVEITGNEEARDYLFSNMFEVAGNAESWERIVIAKNLENTIECIRAEGDSPWYVSAAMMRLPCSCRAAWKSGLSSQRTAA